MILIAFMELCPRCNVSFEEYSDSGMCPACDSLQVESKPPPTLSVAALVVGALPFFLSFSRRSVVTRTVNGITTETVSGMDYIAVGAGVLAVLIGLIAAVRVAGGKGKAMAVLAILLGAYQVAKGFFLF